MEILKCISCEDFANKVIDIYGYFDDFEDLTIFAKHDEAKIVLEKLVEFGFPIYDMEFSDVQCYDKEYRISIMKDLVWCYKAYNTELETYVDDDSSVVLVLNNCNAKLLNHILTETGNVYEICIEDLENSDETYNHLHTCNKCDKDNNCHVELSLDEKDSGQVKGFSMSGFSKNGSWSKSFYSDDPELVFMMLEKWTE